MLQLYLYIYLSIYLSMYEYVSIFITLSVYRQFHKTLPRSSVFLNWISVRFYEMDCMYHKNFMNLYLDIEQKCRNLYSA